MQALTSSCFHLGTPRLARSSRLAWYVICSSFRSTPAQHDQRQETSSSGQVRQVLTHCSSQPPVSRPRADQQHTCRPAGLVHWKPGSLKELRGQLIKLCLVEADLQRTTIGTADRHPARAAASNNTHSSSLRGFAAGRAAGSTVSGPAAGSARPVKPHGCMHVGAQEACTPVQAVTCTAASVPCPQPT